MGQMTNQQHQALKDNSWVDCQPTQSAAHCTKCNSPPSVSVPIAILLYNDSLLLYLLKADILISTGSVFSKPVKCDNNSGLLFQIII